MWPVIYDFGIISFLGFEFHVALYSYGFMLVVAFYTCYVILLKESRRVGYGEKLASGILTAAAIGGIVGTKVY